MEIKRLKVIHIHTHYLLTEGSTKYDGDYFDNINVIIQGNEPYEGPLKDTYRLYSNDNKSLEEIVELCKGAKLVVINSLNAVTSRVVLMLPKDVKIAWRFFGYELYRYLPKLVYSKLTMEKLEKRPLNSFDKFIFQVKILILHIIAGRPIGKRDSTIIKRIDFFIGLFPEEYEMLKKHWKYLPEFIKFPMNPFYFDPEKLKNKKKIIVLGNNKNASNNHLDIIQLIKQSQKKNEYEFQVLFNYGTENKYSEAVREAVKDTTSCRLIESLIPRDEFQFYYCDKAAFVFNGYRQMAMRSIVYSLSCGVKLYLNTKNLIYNWLKYNDFVVFTVEDFQRDLENDNILLDQSQIDHNIDQYNKLTENYTYTDFQYHLYSRLT